MSAGNAVAQALHARAAAANIAPTAGAGTASSLVAVLVQETASALQAAAEQLSSEGADRATAGLPWQHLAAACAAAAWVQAAVPAAQEASGPNLYPALAGPLAQLSGENASCMRHSRLPP